MTVPNNLQSALEAGEAAPALEVCGSLNPYWVHWGQFSGARALLERVLALADTQTVDPVWHVQVLAGLGVMTSSLGEFDEAEPYYARCLHLTRETGDQRAQVLALNRWGLLKLYRTQYAEAQRLLEEALALGRAHGHAAVIPMALLNLSVIWADQGDFATARRYLEEADAEWRRVGHVGPYPPVLEVLAGIALAEGDLPRAEALYAEELAAGRSAGDVRGISVALTGLANVALLRQEYGRCRELAIASARMRQSVGNSLGLASSLETLAWLAAAEGQAELALRLAGGTDAVRRRMGAPLPPVRAQRSERLLAPARQALGQAAADQAFAAGARLPLAELLEQACAPAPAPAPVTAPPAATMPAPVVPRVDTEAESLTPRELEIVSLAARGMTTRAIGQTLYLSPRTVEKHEENIRTKLNLPNRAALVAWAVRRGLVNEAP